MDKVALVLAFDEKTSHVLNQDDDIDSEDGTDEEVANVLAPRALKVRVRGKQKVKRCRHHPVDRKQLEHRFYEYFLFLAAILFDLDRVDVLSDHRC